MPVDLRPEAPEQRLQRRERDAVSGRLSYTRRAISAQGPVEPRLAQICTPRRLAQTAARGLPEAGCRRRCACERLGRAALRAVWLVNRRGRGVDLRAATSSCV